MGNFKKQGGFDKNRGSSGRRNFGGSQHSKRSGNRGFERPQMFDAICDECKKPCEVPFRPSGDKPVYCRECFGKKKGDFSSDYPKRETSSSNFQQNNIARAPLAGAFIEDKRNNAIENQLRVLNAKIDRIIEIIESVSLVAPKQAEKKVATKKKIVGKKE